MLIQKTLLLNNKKLPSRKWYNNCNKTNNNNTMNKNKGLYRANSNNNKLNKVIRI